MPIVIAARVSPTTKRHLKSIGEGSIRKGIEKVLKFYLEQNSKNGSEAAQAKVGD
jgi:hypothetical protein